MHENVKEVMRFSFHNNFFVDRNSQSLNFEYLDQLVDMVCKKDDSEDYEDIANKVLQYDKRIKRIFSPNMEILSLCVSGFNIETSIIDRCIESVSQEDIKKIARCSTTETDFWHKYNVSMALHNLKIANSKLKKSIIDCILYNLKHLYGIKLENIKMYKVRKYGDDIKFTIALNELICLLAKYMDFRFSYQTLDAINLLETFEKTEMYYQIYEELSERKINSLCKQKGLNPIIKNVFKPVVPSYEKDDNEFMFIGVDESERIMADAYMLMRNKFCEFIYESMKAKSMLNKEIDRLNSNIKSKQSEIKVLRKSLAQFQHQIEVVNRDREKEKEELEFKEDAMRKELFSLREYLFSRKIDESEEELLSDEFYRTSYSDVVIVGGHRKWQNKVLNELDGVTVLSTDQNIVDWSFLNDKKIVVIVTNYISHSMYLRLISKIKGQELLYIDFKNIEILKRKLNSLMIKMYIPAR